MVNSYIVLNLEITRLEARQEKITEIAAIRIIDGVVAGQSVTLVNPMRRLRMHITRPTEITDEILKDAPSIEDVIGDAVGFLDDLSLLGHNTTPDYSFLKYMAVNNRLEFEKEGLDTLMLCRAFMPGDVRRNLPCVCSYYHISQLAAHRTQVDTEAAYRLYQELLKLHSQNRPELFTSKPSIHKVKREQPVTRRQKEYLQDLAKCHRIDITVQIDDISRSEASRMIDTIISQYGRIPRQIS